MIRNNAGILGYKHLLVVGAGIETKDTSSWIPVMTSRTVPTPLVSSASSTWDNAGGDSGLDRMCSFRAFDSSTAGTGWVSYDHTLPTAQWVKIDLGSGNAIKIWQYGMMARDGGSGDPKTWTLQGSNDDSNWTTVDTQTNVSSWAANTTKMFVMATPCATAYRYYKWVVTNSQNYPTNSYVGILGLFIYKYTST